MINSIDDIFREYENLLNDCYRETLQRVNLLNKNCPVRKEYSQRKEDNTVLHFIEIFSDKPEGDDNDYGVTIDMQLIGDSEWLVSQVDVMKTNGSLYSENLFNLIEDSRINQEEYTKSVNLVRSLPESTVDIFIRDYLT